MKNIMLVLSPADVTIIIESLRYVARNEAGLSQAPDLTVASDHYESDLADAIEEAKLEQEQR